MRTISNNKPSNSKQSAPDQLKTDQEILEELKAASGGERKRSFGLTAFIVLLAIVIGVFTYMNRKDNDSENNAANTSNVSNTTASDNETANEANTTPEESDEPSEDTAESEEPADTEEPANTTASEESSNEAPGEEPTATSTRSDTALTETAQVGEGVTHLARRAVAAFLQERGISDLQATHKVFIEDTLARQAGYGWIDVGTTQTFEMTSIESAISAARALTPAELSNLEQYATLVPGL